MANPLIINITASLQGLKAKLNEARSMMRDKLKGSQLGGMGSILGAATPWALAGTGLYKFTQYVNGLIDSMAEARNTARELGVSINDISAIDTVAAFSGSNKQDAISALGKIRELSTKAALGSKSAADELAAVGLSLDFIKSSSPEEVLYRVSEVLRSINDDAKRAAVSMQVFGKSPESMTAFRKPLLTYEKGAGMFFSGSKVEKASNSVFEYGNQGFNDLAVGKDSFLQSSANITKFLVGAIYRPLAFSMKIPLKSMSAIFTMGQMIKGKASKYDLINSVYGTNLEDPSKLAKGDAAAQARIASQFAGVNPLSIGAGFAGGHPLPVDQLRQIGAYMPENGGAVVVSNEQVEISKEIREEIHRLYREMQDLNYKFPVQSPKR